MANEIVVLETPHDSINVLFLFPVGSPKQVGGVAVVPTPSSGLFGSAVDVVSVAEKAGMDSGTLVFRSVSFKTDARRSVADLKAELQARYAKMKTALATEYVNRYRFAGARLDAV